MARKPKSQQPTDKAPRKSKAKPSNVVNLTVHKNTKHLRALRERKRDLKGAGRVLADIPRLSGWCVVVWDEDGEPEALYDAGCIPATCLPAFISMQLGAQIERTRVESTGAV